MPPLSDPSPHPDCRTTGMTCPPISRTGTLAVVPLRAGCWHHRWCCSGRVTPQSWSASRLVVESCVDCAAQAQTDHDPGGGFRCARPTRGDEIRPGIVNSVHAERCCDASCGTRCRRRCDDLRRLDCCRRIPRLRRLRRPSRDQLGAGDDHFHCPRIHIRVDRPAPSWCGWPPEEAPFLSVLPGCDGIEF